MVDDLDAGRWEVGTAAGRQHWRGYRGDRESAEHLANYVAPQYIPVLCAQAFERREPPEDMDRAQGWPRETTEQGIYYLTIISGKDVFADLTTHLPVSDILDSNHANL